MDEFYFDFDNLNDMLFSYDFDFWNKLQDISDMNEKEDMSGDVVVLSIDDNNNGQKELRFSRNQYETFRETLFQIYGKDKIISLENEFLKNNTESIELQEKEREQREREQAEAIEKQRRLEQMKREIEIFTTKRYIVNYVINIILCLASAFLSNFNIFVMLAVFIGYDIFCILLNKIIIRRDIKQIMDLIEVPNVDKYKKELSRQLKRAKEDKDVETELVLLETQKQLEQKLKNLKEQETKIEKQEEQEMVFVERNKTLKKSFDDTIKKLREFEYNAKQIPNEEYEKVLDNIKKLERIINNNEDAIEYIDTRFSVLSNELIKLLNSFKRMDELTDEYDKKVLHLINEYNNYIQRTIEKIEFKNKMMVDVSYDVILENIKKAQQ